MAAPTHRPALHTAPAGNRIACLPGTAGRADDSELFAAVSDFRSVYERFTTARDEATA